MFSLIALSSITFGQPHIYMLPSSTVIVQDTTEVTYTFQMFSPNFEPVKSYKGTLKLSNGMQGSLSSQKQGLYTASFTFDKDTPTQNLSVELFGKVTYVTKEGKITKDIQQEFSQHIRALDKPTYQITTDIQDAIDVTQRLTFEVSSTQNIDPSYIAIESSFGKVTDIQQKSPNVLEFKIDDNKKRKFPHNYIITLTDLRFTDVHASFVVPKSGKVSFPIKDVQPKSKISIQIQDTVFGPVIATSDGTASVPITVPPNIQQGKTIVEHQNSKTILDLDLLIPATKDIVLFPTPDLPGDPQQKYDVYFYTTLQNPTLENFEISAEKGSFGNIQQISQQVFAATYTPPFSELGESDTITLQNTKTSQKDRLKIQLRAYIPNNTVVTTPSSLGKSATQLEVEISGNYDVKKSLDNQIHTLYQEKLILFLQNYHIKFRFQPSEMDLWKSLVTTHPHQPKTHLIILS